MLRRVLTVGLAVVFVLATGCSDSPSGSTGSGGGGVAPPPARQPKGAGANA